MNELGALHLKVQQAFESNFTNMPRIDDGHSEQFVNGYSQGLLKQSEAIYNLRKEFESSDKKLALYNELVKALEAALRLALRYIPDTLPNGHFDKEIYFALKKIYTQAKEIKEL